MIHIAAVTQLRLDTEGRTSYRHKRDDGKKPLEAIRCLKRRISDAIYRQLLADAQRTALPNAADLPGAGPGGHCGTSLESSAVDLPPHIDTSDQPLPGPARPTLPGTKTRANAHAASAPRPPRRRARAVKVERPTGRTTLTVTSAGAHSPVHDLTVEVGTDTWPRRAGCVGNRFPANSGGQPGGALLGFPFLLNGAARATSELRTDIGASRGRVMTWPPGRWRCAFPIRWRRDTAGGPPPGIIVSRRLSLVPKIGSTGADQLGLRGAHAVDHGRLGVTPVVVAWSNLEQVDHQLQVVVDPLR